mmetsp:Transcript_114339/g.363365  ORF Transcript_114339/g.363365 Transcript_114339/m.363365 type:complete len:225 (-) Transcript_114339:19-693(-)
MKSSSAVPLIFTTSGVNTSTKSRPVTLAPSFFARLPFAVLNSLYCAVLLRASSSSLVTTDISNVRLSKIERVFGYLASSHCQFFKYSRKGFSWRCDLTLKSALGSSSTYWRSRRCKMLSTDESAFCKSSVKRMRLSKDPNNNDRSPSGTSNFHGPSSAPRPRGAIVLLLFRAARYASFSELEPCSFEHPAATIQNSWPTLILPGTSSPAIKKAGADKRPNGEKC